MRDYRRAINKMIDVGLTVTVVLFLCVIGLLMFGCEESQQSPVWGKGELPADHQEFFGDDNASRLNYVQNRVLDKHAAILKILAIRVLALEAVDPNAMRLESLESDMKKSADSFHRAYQRLKNEDFAKEHGLTYDAVADSFVELEE